MHCQHPIFFQRASYLLLESGKFQKMILGAGHHLKSFEINCYT
jgi:hypothetical protein